MAVPDGVTTEVVQLPFQEGGLGLRSAVRLAPAACWASWADCLSQVRARAPQVCTQLLQELEGPPSQAQWKLKTLPLCSQSKAWRCPSGPNFRTLTSAPRSPSVLRWESGLMVGNFTHLLLATPSLQQARICHLCPRTTKLCGPHNEDHVLRGISPAFPPAQRRLSRLKSSLLVRLHLPLHVDDRFCKCVARLDLFGHHRSACSRVGLLKPRGTPAEICVARICREAGTRVKENQLLSELNTVVPVTDQRRIEVIANGLPFWGAASSWPLTPQWSWP